MGIKDLLPHLIGGKHPEYSFYESRLSANGSLIIVDAAGALWQFANHYASDFLRENFLPALSDFARLLNNLRSICGWNMLVVFDGRPNPDKAFEDERRRQKAIASGKAQVKNTSKYINHAAHVCKHMNIKYMVAPYEADGQVVRLAMDNSSIIVTGDSDLTAIGSSFRGTRVEKVMIVKSWRSESFRIIDLGVGSTDGELPLYDLFSEHGRIVFQMYASVVGCDFTEHERGIPGLAYAGFMRLMEMIDGAPTPSKLAFLLWREHESIMLNAGFSDEHAVLEHISNIVDIYASPHVYDSSGNITDFSGEVITPTTTVLKQHMSGLVDSQTTNPFTKELRDAISKVPYDQLLHISAVDCSTIRGIRLPDGKTPSECNVTALRDFMACRGCSVSGTKSEMALTSECHLFLEKQVSRTYVDRHPDKNGSLFISINTSSTRDVGAILLDYRRAFANVSDAPVQRSLIEDTHTLFCQGLFETSYDNISRVAPELKEGLIYRTFGHLGSSKEQKSTGDAYKRCVLNKQDLFHALAFVPDSNKCIILAKSAASMKGDEKTKNQTAEGEPGKRAEYLTIIELRYEQTAAIEHMHDLGVFVEVLRTFCGMCVAGQGLCRHCGEKLWAQYFHWTDERFGIDRPSTIDGLCWGPNGRVLVADVCAKLSEQQTVSIEKTIEAQEAKMKRGVKRNCTEGNSADYQVYMSATKQQPMPNRFTAERLKPLFDLIRSERVGEDELDIGRPCRGEIRWFGATDEGLRDVRGDAHLWALECEKEMFDEMTANNTDNKTPVEIGETILSRGMDLEMRKKLYLQVHKKEYDGEY